MLFIYVESAIGRDGSEICKNNENPIVFGLLIRFACKECLVLYFLTVCFSKSIREMVREVKIICGEPLRPCQ